MVVAALIAAVVVAGASAYKANQAQQAAANRQKEAGKVSAAEQYAQRQAQVRQQVREDRVRRAQIVQGSEDTGVLNSSGQFGAVSGIGTSTAANIGTLGRGQVTGNAYGAAMQGAADASARANTWTAIGSVASSAAGALAGTQAVQQSSTYQTLFGSPKTGINAPPKG